MYYTSDVYAYQPAYQKFICVHFFLFVIICENLFFLIESFWILHICENSSFFMVVCGNLFL